MADGTISVDLQLIVADALKQAELAAKSFSKILSTPAMTPGGQQFSAQKAVADTAKMTAAEQQHTKAVKETTKALTEQQKAAQRLRDIASGKISPTQPDMKITGVNSRGAPAWMSPEQAQKFSKEEYFERKKLADDLRAQRAAARGTGGIGSLATNPMLTTPTGIPPILPKVPTKSPAINGTLIRALVGSIAGSTLAGPIGAGLGASAMGASGPFAIAIGAATAALNLLRKAVSDTVAAYEHARQIYARTITSGFGTGMTVKRGMLASIIGVSENDILQFGAAIEYLNPKIAWATKILAQTTTPLTQVAWEVAVLKENFHALFAEIATAAAPAMMALTKSINDFIQSFSDEDIKDMVTTMGLVSKSVITVIGAISLSILGLVEIFATLEDSLTWLGKKAVNAMTYTQRGEEAKYQADQAEKAEREKIVSEIKPGQAVDMAALNKRVADAKQKAYDDSMSGSALDTKHSFDTSAAVINTTDKIKDLMGKILTTTPGKKTSDKMPEPMAYMKQMPASSWERMGLMIGGGGGTNYGQQTANHTKPVPALLAKIYAAIVAGDKFNISNPAGIPASP